MTKNEPEFIKPAAIPVQLCLFYNSITNGISFSSSSPDSFFETRLNLLQDPPFLDAFSGAAAETLRTEWQACRQLRENGVRNFTISADREDAFSEFSFIVMRHGSPYPGDPALLVVSVTRTAVSKKTSAPNNEYAEFIELAGHDLDSPLRKLSMLVDRITSKYENTVDEDTLGYVQRARACLSDMRSMIENLSLLARLGNTTRKTGSCDLDSITRAALKDLQEPGSEEKILISTGSLPIVTGDAGQYRQLFVGLLDNAFKFRKKETVAAVEIVSEETTNKEKQLWGLSPGKLYYKIIISDNGIGFRQEHNERIFLPFVRLNGKSEYPGNGIGLAISRKIVENHCGIIHAEGKENFGARFILFLPLSPD